MSSQIRIHSALPEQLAAAVDAVLGAAGIEHVAHGDETPVEAAEAAAGDAAAVALVGPFLSSAVAEAVEATGPAGLALLAPVATWAGVTHDDEPGADGDEDDPADHRGTVFRMVARDTEVAARVAMHLRDSRQRAYVVAGSHPYGQQIDGQLRLGRLDRAGEADTADVIVVCGLVGEPEIGRVAALPPLPVIAFDGVQGQDFGEGREVRIALPFAPAGEDDPFDHIALGAASAGRAAELLAAAIGEGAKDRAAVLDALKASGEWDDHGDPVYAAVWLWRVGDDGALLPDRAL